MEVLITLAISILLLVGVFALDHWYRRRQDRLREEALRRCADDLRRRDPENFAKYGVPWKPRQ